MRKSGFILLIDSYLVRKGLLSLLKQINGVSVLQEFNNTQALVAFLAKHSFDFLIIDQSLFDTSSDLFVQNPMLLEKTILLKNSLSEKKAGAGSAKQVNTSIYLDGEKEKTLSTIQGLLDQELVKNKDQASDVLSPREITIVRLVSLGLTNRQIAENLFLSAHTVMTHRKNINSKLGIKSVSGLTVYAIVNNIITIEEVTSLPSE